MKQTVAAALVFLGLCSSVQAQVLPTSQERTVAHVVSWATVLTAEALDTVASFRSEHRGRAFALQGARVAAAQGGAALLKLAFPAARPCTPSHECGSDSEMSGFPSGHMALGCSTFGGPSLSFTIPLAGATAAGRWLAWRHFPSQIALGCVVGVLASRIR